MQLTSLYFPAAAALAAALLLGKLIGRLRLSAAKHPSLRGHGRIARRVARWLPYYGFSEDAFFGSDGAPEEVAASRRRGFERLAKLFAERSPNSVAFGRALEEGLSDAEFTNAYRVPFQYRDYVRRRLALGNVLEASAGARVRDLDGQWSYDVSGSYGVNVFGYDFYKACIDAAVERARPLGPVLGAYHPIVLDNVKRLQAVSGLDEVSFHMSGTEAVMQAVRLARFHTRKRRLVLFCGAYHGWWDGVQPGLGNDRRVDDVYVLADMSRTALRVLETRNDIACVLVNPLQALHPNASAPGDATLVDSGRRAHFDRRAYSEWLVELRSVCTRRGIALIFDEVFVGFRLAYGGAQEYFGVAADLVTYGKTLGGGFPVGVVCGKRRWMKRFDAAHPSRVCFARGTFNSHPYVMAAMNEFLRRIDGSEIRAHYAAAEALWNERVARLNRRLEAAGAPVAVVNLVSIWTVVYKRPSRYNWMFQFYLRSAGLALSWVGSGRMILSHAVSDYDFECIAARFVEAARAMDADAWWWAHEGLSDRSIRRRILRELLAARLARFGRAAGPAGLDQPAGSTTGARPAAAPDAASAGLSSKT